MVVWLIGLSAAGKTTVARELVGRLREQHDGVVLLDGDELREVWGDDLGHTVDDRRRNARRVSHLCRLLDRQGVHVVAAILSMFPEWQAWNRRELSDYFEVFLDVPMDELERRDPRGLYAAVRAGRTSGVVGVDIPFPPPPHADLVLRPPEVLEPPDRIAARILAALHLPAPVR
jgi:adenylylsulfate kinase-like enzyme